MKTTHFLSALLLVNAAALLACSGAPSSSDNGTLQQGLAAQHCGGNIANAAQCPDGFECVPDPSSTLPFGDVGGICQALDDGAPEPQHCGGNIANPPQCPDGFECVPDPANPFLFGDVGGICQASSEPPPPAGHHHRRHHHSHRG